MSTPRRSSPCEAQQKWEQEAVRLVGAGQLSRPLCAAGLLPPEPAANSRFPQPHRILGRAGNDTIAGIAFKLGAAAAAPQALRQLLLPRAAQAVHRGSPAWPIGSLQPWHLA